MTNSNVKIGNMEIDVNQLADKIKNYDIELTRTDVINVINETSDMAHSETILDAVKDAYHINM